MTMQRFGFTELQVVDSLVMNGHGIGRFYQLTAAFGDGYEQRRDCQVDADMEMQMEDFGLFPVFF